LALSVIDRPTLRIDEVAVAARIPAEDLLGINCRAKGAARDCSNRCPGKRVATGRLASNPTEQSAGRSACDRPICGVVASTWASDASAAGQQGRDCQVKVSVSHGVLHRSAAHVIK
jgi:hypothetical protein